MGLDIMGWDEPPHTQATGLTTNHRSGNFRAFSFRVKKFSWSRRSMKVSLAYVYYRVLVLAMYVGIPELKGFDPTFSHLIR